MTLQASNDRNTWVDLDTFINSADTQVMVERNVDNDNYYMYYERMNTYFKEVLL